MEKFDEWGNSISEFVDTSLRYLGVSSLYVDELRFVVILLVLTLLCFISDFVAKKILLGLVSKLVKTIGMIFSLKRKCSQTWLMLLLL